MIYVGNAFSLGMVPRELLPFVSMSACTTAPKLQVGAFVSCVGHADTAAVLGVPMNRINVTLQPGDVLYVAQLMGGRLPEGSKTLPEGFRFEWVRVSV